MPPLCTLDLSEAASASLSCRNKQKVISDYVTPQKADQPRQRRVSGQEAQDAPLPAGTVLGWEFNSKANRFVCRMQDVAAGAVVNGMPLGQAGIEMEMGETFFEADAERAFHLCHPLAAPI